MHKYNNLASQQWKKDFFTFIGCNQNLTAKVKWRKLIDETRQ